MIPVTIRRAMTTAKPLEVRPKSLEIPSGIRAFTRAPLKAQVARSFVGDTRSLRFSTALASAPMTNPTWTLIVSQARALLERFHSVLRTLVTAEAENQRAIASHCTIASRTSCRHLAVWARIELTTSTVLVPAGCIRADALLDYRSASTAGDNGGCGSVSLTVVASSPPLLARFESAQL